MESNSFKFCCLNSLNSTENDFPFWFYATSNEQILQWVTIDFLQRATSATSIKWILKRVTRDFVQRATSTTSNKRILQRVTSHILQQATSTTSKKQIWNE